jgi:hypothetical protein
MKIIIRSVRYISKTIKIITNKYIIRFNLFGVRIIIIDVESFDFFDFGDQAFPEFISGIIFNIFNVEYKIEAIFSIK